MASEVKHIRGELDPESLVGFSTITEHVVIDVLGDATKEKFGAPYDLFSRSLGKINVKYSCLHRIRKHYYWNFAKRQSAEIPDYYICLGMDEYNTEINRVWIIPGTSNVVSKQGITISPNNDERVQQYAVDHVIYNRTFQEMDIQKLPEFRNTTKPKVSEFMYEMKKHGVFDHEYSQSFKPLNAVASPAGFNMSDKDGQIRLVQDAITSLSEKQGKMTIEDIQKETGIDGLAEILHDLDNCGYIYYVSGREFKKTP